MSAGLDVMLSPYDLAPRAASIFVGALLASRVFTLLPTPQDAADFEALRVAGARSPMFLRLAESWRWSGPLWRAGVIVPGLSGARLADEMTVVQTRLSEDESFAALRPLLDRDNDLGVTEKFESLCRDLLLGGANPAVSVPLTAGIERFASASGLAIVRVTPASLAGRLERHNAKVAARLNLAAIVEADADDFLAIRGSMSHTLDSLRAALVGVLERMREGDDLVQSNAMELFELARVNYEQVLLQRVEAMRNDARRSGRRIKVARVSITGSMVECGASLSAAASAARKLASSGGALTGEVGRAAPSSPSSALATRAVTVLTVKPLRVDV